MLCGRFGVVWGGWVWRLMHAMAYVAWPMGIWHGLLSGRHGKPYVDWSYGALVAAVGVALLVRFVAKDRSGQTAAQPVPERLASAWPPAAGAAALGQAGFGTGHLAISSGAVPVGRPQQLALPAGTGPQVTANLPADRGQVVDRVQFGHDETAVDVAYDDPRGQYRQDDPRGQYYQDDPRGHFHQDDSRGQYYQDDPRGYFPQDDPRGQYYQDDPRGHFHQDDPRGQYRQDDPREYIRQDDPRGHFHQDDSRGQYYPDDPREYFPQDDPRGQYRRDDSRGQYYQDDPRGQYYQDD